MDRTNLKLVDFGTSASCLLRARYAVSGTDGLGLLPGVSRELDMERADEAVPLQVRPRERASACPTLTASQRHPDAPPRLESHRRGVGEGDAEAESVVLLDAERETWESGTGACAECAEPVGAARVCWRRRVVERRAGERMVRERRADRVHG
eukprot:341968-Rhodomonas_salina.2